MICIHIYIVFVYICIYIYMYVINQKCVYIYIERERVQPSTDGAGLSESFEDSFPSGDFPRLECGSGDFPRCGSAESERDFPWCGSGDFPRRDSGESERLDLRGSGDRESLPLLWRRKEGEPGGDRAVGDLGGDLARPAVAGFRLQAMPGSFLEPSIRF